MIMPAPAVFGRPPAALASVPAEAVQLSPLIPGAAALDELAPGTLSEIAMLAVPGTVERRRDIALTLTALAPGAPFTILAPKDAGGSRLASELAGFGCETEDRPKRHHRICTGRRPERLDNLSDAIAAGAPRRDPTLGLWTQPGVFSWDRLDPGTALLMNVLPALSGHGADLGCGIGVLAHPILASAKVSRLDLLDIDRRAIRAARRNVDDPRAHCTWADAREAQLSGLDFVVTNPPFHASGAEDKGLGLAFIRKAAAILHNGGHLWLVANRHLPYEAALNASFKRVTTVVDAGGFKVMNAAK